MRVALVVPPFISVPPKRYGGTELFAGHLAQGLSNIGVEVVVYTNGESTIPVERRWMYPEGVWPITEDIQNSLMDVNHGAWAVRDALDSCDVIHISNAPSVVHSRFTKLPFVYTIHHPHQSNLSDFYAYYPDIHYVTISDFQRREETLPNIRTIHHGIDPQQYVLSTNRREYLAFLGRIAPVKGTHHAIEVAKKSGIPLKIAGEVQPMFRDYYEKMVKPHVDGKFIEYVGEADLAAKNELLGNARALLFPIEWDEPFGLVMIESMACGTPVLAFPHGSVPEIVKNGVSGFICNSASEMAERVADLDALQPADIRAYVAEQFSMEKMVRSYATLYEELIKEPSLEQRAIA